MTKRADFSVLRTIPIEDVCKTLGIPLKQTGEGRWNVKDERDKLGHTSLTIFKRTNTWYRFSSSKGGSPLDLVMEWKNCDLSEAASFLSTHFPHYK